MAASIGSGVRVRLNFDDSCHITCESSIYKSFWFLVNLGRQKTIESFATELSSRFDISSDLRVELSLDGCLLPRWESTAILRDNDLVTVAAAAAVDETVGKKRSIGSERSVTSESNSRQHEKKKKRRRCVVDEVDGTKEKKRRKEVNDMELVEEETTGCGGGGTDRSSEKRRNREKQDTSTNHNSVQSSVAVRNEGCHIIWSEKESTDRLPSKQMEADRANRGDVETDSSSPGVVASTFSASAVEEENESQLGDNVMVSYIADETENQSNEVGLAVNDSPDEVKKKSKRTRRSRKNRKVKNPTLLDPQLKSNLNIVSAQTLEASSEDVQRRTFQWQNTNLPYSNPSAHSHPQHIIFDDDDPDSGTPNEQNLVIDGIADLLPNQNLAAETICEGLMCNKEALSRLDKDCSSHEPKRSSQAVFPNDEQVSQLNETRRDASSLLEVGATGEEDSCRLMLTASSNSRGLSHDQKLRQIRSRVSDLSPFSNVQVFKRQRGTKLQCLPSTAEPGLRGNGHHVPAPTRTKWQATEKEENILDVRPKETMKDYSVYELLLGPPRPGDVIAYKILQLSDDYSPVISSYKEAKVQKFVHATRIVELEPKNLPIPSQLKKSTGRFDLTIEDEHEILTNSVMQDGQFISISWDLLLEPRLVA